MRIDEAIKEQEEFLIDNPHIQELPWAKGMKLGIEALKHCQDMRHSVYSDLTGLLPGETKEYVSPEQ